MSLSTRHWTEVAEQHGVLALLAAERGDALSARFHGRLAASAYGSFLRMRSADRFVAGVWVAVAALSLGAIFGPLVLALVRGLRG